MADTDFEKLKQWYEAIQNAKKNSDGTYTVDGKKVSASQYRQYKKSSKIVYDEAVKKTRPQPLAPLGPPATAATTTTVPKTNAPASYDPKTGAPLDSKGNVIPVTVPPNAVMPTTTTSTTIAPPPTTAPKTTTTTTAPTGPTAPASTTAVTPTTTTSTTNKNTPAQNKPKDYGRVKPPQTITNEGDTYTNSKNVKFTFKGGKWVRTATLGGADSNNWQAIVQEEFGSLWDVYNDNADVKKVLDKSVKEGWYNDTVKLTAELQNTNWFRATQSSARRYAIRQSTDPATLQDEINKEIEQIRAESLVSGVTLSDNTLKDLAEKKTKFGWTTQQVSNAVGSEAVAAAKIGGAQGMTDLRQGAIGTRLRGVADNFAQKPTDTMLDTWVAEIMQGTKSEQGFNDLMKQQASTQYRSLAPQIDKGLDVKTAVSMYSNSAQSVLGIDPATIDWTQDKWNRALNYQDPKTNEYRQMDSWEWNKYLRAQPEWQETDDAKRTYRSAAFTLAQAFGKTT